jgi:hypothetical protein
MEPVNASRGPAPGGAEPASDDVQLHLRRIVAELEILIQTWIDGGRLAAREALARWALRAMLGLLVLTAAITATIFALSGAAAAIAALVGIPEYGGRLIVGVATLGIPLAWRHFGAQLRARRELDALRRKYPHVDPVIEPAPLSVATPAWEVQNG